MSNGNIFGDNLHFKMCKKIAQLTKVIYNLNTKNEDIQDDIKMKTATYKNELNGTIKDAATKLSELRDELDEREHEVMQIGTQLKEEKKMVKVELKSLNQKLVSIEDDIRKKFQEKILDVKRTSRDDINKLSETKKDLECIIQKKEHSYKIAVDAYEKKIESFLQQHKDDINSIEKRHEENIQNLRKSHDDEIYELEQKMMLSQEENLIREREANNSKIVNLRNELQANEADQMSSLRHEHNIELKQQHDEFVLRIEEIEREKIILDEKSKHLIACLKMENKKYEEAIDEIKVLQTKLNRSNYKLDETNKLNKQTVAILQRDISILHQTTQKYQNRIKEYETELSIMEKSYQCKDIEVSKLRNDLKDNKEKIESITTLNATLEKEKEQVINTLNSELQNANANADVLKLKLAETKSLSHVRMTQEEEKSKHLKAKIAKMMEEKIQITRENDGKILSLETILKSTRLKAEEEKKKGFKELCLLRAISLGQIHQLKTQCQEKSDFAEKKYLAKIDELERQVANYHSRTEQKVSVALSEAQLIAEKKMEAACLQWDIAKKSFIEKVNALETELLKEKEISISKVNDMKQENARLYAVIDEHLKEKKSMMFKLKNMESTNLKQRDKVSIIEWEKKELQQSMDNLHTKLSTLKEEVMTFEKENVDNKESHNRKLETTRQHYHNLILVLRNEQKSEMVKLKCSYEEKMQSQEKNLRNEIESLEKNHLMTIQSLNKSFGIERALIESDKKKIEKNLLHCQRLHQSELSELKNHYETETSKITNHMKEEFGRAYEVEKKELLSKINILKTNHDEELTQQYEQINAKHELSMKNRLEVEKKSKQIEMDTKLHEISDKYENKLVQLKRSFMQVKEALELNIFILIRKKKNLGSYMKQIMSVLCKENKNILALKATISRFLEKIIEKVSSDKENCNNTHNLEQRSLQEKLNDSNIQLKAIMSRWNNREGRPQDLDRIQKLEKEVKNYKEREKIAKDQMLYFKRELLNREENFNVRFSRRPQNVGVMEVIKDKNINDRNKQKETKKNIIKRRRFTSLSVLEKPTHA